jgi:retron-type reverse transcriptase
MVSFDVISLFTKVPIADSLELLGHHFEDDFLALFIHVQTFTYFCFDGQFYKQTDGVAMGLPLSPIITNFFIEDFEKKALDQVAHKPICWFRYVDDTCIIWPHGQEKLTEFLNHLIGLHIKYSSQWKKKKTTTFHSWTLTSTEKLTAP